MSQCTDKRFRDMRHGYELGLLDDTDLAAFEQHLLECPACFAEVNDFHAASQHILQSPAIRDLVSKSATATKSAGKTAPARRIWSTLIPAAAIILLVLVLKPWHIEIHPDDEAIASENRLVIACFDNMAQSPDNHRLGEAVSNLLITDLAESHYLQVVSSQRVYDLLKSMGLPEECQVDKDVSTEIAHRANARWLLTGSIIQDAPELVIASQLIDVSTGNTVATQRVSGDSLHNIFALVDRLTVEVKHDLVLPPGAFNEPDRMIADVTTHSPVAYAYYLDGVSNLNKLYRSDAADAFESAIKVDSTFAMAYYQLAELRDKNYIKKALQYIDNASKKDQHYIRSRYETVNGDNKAAIAELDELIRRFPDEKEAYLKLGTIFFGQGKFQLAIDTYTKAITIDPLLKLAYNQLAYCYSNINDFEKSLWAINKYIDIAPDEANPYDSRGEILGKMGKIDASIESYKTAIDIKPDFYDSWQKLGLMYAFKGEVDKAENCLGHAANNSEPKMAFWNSLLIASLKTRRGDFTKALEQLDDLTQKSGAKDNCDSDCRNAFALKASLLSFLGRHAEAIKTLETARDLTREDEKIFLGEMFIQIYSEAGDFKQAQKILGDMAAQQSENKKNPYVVKFSEGCIDLGHEQYDEAVLAFNQAISGFSESYKMEDYYVAYTYLARAYMGAGQYEDAIKTYDKLMNSYTSNRIFWSFYDIEAHYYLGMAFEKTGQTEKAIREYDTFVTAWKKSTVRLPDINDAQTRLTRLRKSS